MGNVIFESAAKRNGQKFLPAETRGVGTYGDNYNY